ncbi:MAG: tape measure protein [Marinovum sp.]|nr:tape measure protein [Marinovum sp.]
MKFSMTFSAIDKASKVMRKIMASEKRLAAAARHNADKTIQNTRRTERAMNALGRAGRKSLDVIVRGSAQAKRAIAALHRKTIQLGTYGMGQIGQGWQRARGGLLAGAAAITLAYGSAAAAASGLVGTAADFEKFQTILTTTEGSAEAASKAMDWVSSFAVSTPYELDQVTASFVQLRAYGLDPTNGLLMTLGDTSAAMGKPLMQAVEAVADAVTGENERLKEFGIKAAKASGKITYEYTNAAGKQMRATVKAGDRLAIQQTLMGIMNEKYAGSMQKLSQTWEGMTSNLWDLWTKFQMMIMKSGLFDWMKGRLGEILDTINRLEADGTLQAWATQIGQTIQTALENAWAFMTDALAVIQELSGYLSKAAEYVGGWRNLLGILAGIAFAPTLISTAAGLVQIVTGLAALSTALMANPIVLVIAAIAGGVYLIYKNWDKIEPYFTALWDGIKQTVETVWNWLKSAFAWSPTTLITENWQGIKEGLSAPLELGKDAIELTWSGFKTLFAWHPVSLITSNWEGISAAITSSVTDAEASLRTAWSGVTEWLDGAFGKVWEAIPTVEWEGLINLQGIKDAWNSVTGWMGEAAAKFWDLLPEMPDLELPAWLSGQEKIADPQTILDAASAAEKLAGQYPKLSAAADGALKATQVAVSGIDTHLAGTDFTDRGVALMRTLADGIRAGTHLVVDATAAATQKVRDHLPSSPAKTGPLSDIHRLKFGETIAGSINAKPMVAAMRGAAAATMAAASITPQLATATAAVPSSAAVSNLPTAAQSRTAQSAASIASPSGARSREGSSAPITVTYGDFHFDSASPENLTKFRDLLRQHKREIAALLAQHQARQKRKEH